MKQSKGIGSVVRKALLSTAVLVFMLVGGLFVSAALSQDPVPAHAAETTDAALRAEIEELRALVLLLITNMNNSNNQNPQTTPAGVPPAAVVPNYPAHQPVQQSIAPAPTPQATPAPTPQATPGGWATPSPGWTSPTPGNWSSPSPGGWSWSTWQRGPRWR